MGYRSQVYLKTTTEGYLVMKKLNDSIEKTEEKPLQYAEIKKTPTGFYKISFDDIKWYEGTFKDVDNFMKGLSLLDEQDIPYGFIRLGEDTEDIEYRNNYTDDMPEEILTFEPVVDVNDDDWGSYEVVVDDSEISHVTETVFGLFNIYEKDKLAITDLYKTVRDDLRTMNGSGCISSTEYNYALEHLEGLFSEWFTDKEKRKG